MAEPAKQPQQAAVSSRDAEEQANSVPRLLRHLVDDVAVLLRKELALAASEVSRSVDDAKKGISSLVGGGAVLYAGFIFLLLAATLGLAEVVEPWLAALIVGGVVAIIGLVMLQAGRKKMQAQNFSLDHTADSLRKDREMVVGRSTS
jgi:uncharacterized membrane protein YqjE